MEHVKHMKASKGRNRRTDQARIGTAATGWLADDVSVRDVQAVRVQLLLAYLLIGIGLVLVALSRGELADWIVYP